MKLEKQVCSLELAKRLKELDVKQESLWYWHFNTEASEGWVRPCIDYNRYKEFETKYKSELEENSDSLNEIKKTIKDKKTITLLYASKDSTPIHAVVLQQVLQD